MHELGKGGEVEDQRAAVSMLVAHEGCTVGCRRRVSTGNAGYADDAGGEEVTGTGWMQGGCDIAVAVVLERRY